MAITLVEKGYIEKDYSDDAVDVSGILFYNAHSELPDPARSSRDVPQPDVNTAIN